MLPPHQQVLETGYASQASVTRRILSPGHRYWFANKHGIQFGPLRMKEAVALNSWKMRFLLMLRELLGDTHEAVCCGPVPFATVQV